MRERDSGSVFKVAGIPPLAWLQQKMEVRLEEVTSVHHGTGDGLECPKGSSGHEAL